MDSNCIVHSLHLSNNNFSGELSPSLKNCKQLTVLSLGKNKFSGKIPVWIGDSLSHLKVFSVRSNHFHGCMPRQLSYLRKLQVLDLSQNNVSGTIPKCYNLSVMTHSECSTATSTYLFPISFTSDMGGDAANFQDEVSLIWKGIDSRYKNTLGLVKSIDLSNNKLSGEPPEEFMSLIGLISLNLSGNYLSEPIPVNIGKLSLLNSLDLSKNLFTSGIPESFPQLNSLGVLNLANNNLSGKIPSNTELRRFDACSYMGNPELYGSPLPKICPGEEPAQFPTTTVHTDSEEGFVTRGCYVSMLLGFIVGFWGFYATFTLNRPRRHAYFRFLNDIGDEINILIVVNVAKLQRQL